MLAIGLFWRLPDRVGVSGLEKKWGPRIQGFRGCSGLHLNPRRLLKNAHQSCASRDFLILALLDEEG